MEVDLWKLLEGWVVPDGIRFRQGQPVWNEGHYIHTQTIYVTGSKGTTATEFSWMCKFGGTIVNAADAVRSIDKAIAEVS